MKKGWLLLPLIVALTLMAVFVLGLTAEKDDTHPSQLIGQAMPAINAPALLESHPAFAPTSDGPRLVNLFASWCVPCIAEIPVLMEMKARGVTIDGIALRDKAEDVAPFLARHGDPYRQIGDDPESMAQLTLGSSGVPESYLVDAKGIIRYQHIGPIMAQDLETMMAEWEKLQ